MTEGTPGFTTMGQAVESAMTEMKLAQLDPLYGIHRVLSSLDRQMLTSPDGKRVTVSLEAIHELLKLRSAA